MYVIVVVSTKWLYVKSIRFWQSRGNHVCKFIIVFCRCNEWKCIQCYGHVLGLVTETMALQWNAQSRKRTKQYRKLFRKNPYNDDILYLAGLWNWMRAIHLVRYCTYTRSEFDAKWKTRESDVCRGMLIQLCTATKFADERTSSDKWYLL